MKSGKRTNTEDLYQLNPGLLLLQARLKKGMTQEQLAAKCGTNKSYISKIENNIKEVRISTMQRIVEDGLEGHLEILIEL